MANKHAMIAEIDAKIEETEKLATEAQRWANQLSMLRNNLDVLKRAREILLDEQREEGVSKFVPVFPAPPRQADNARVAEGTSGSPLSIGATVEKILREAGTAMSLQDIWENLKLNGRSDVPLKTLGGVISQYVAKGRIERTERATYRAAIIHTGGGRLVGRQP
jgi:hypothetical protein